MFFPFRGELPELDEDPVAAEDDEEDREGDELEASEDDCEGDDVREELESVGNTMLVAREADDDDEGVVLAEEVAQDPLGEWGEAAADDEGFIGTDSCEMYSVLATTAALRPSSLESLACGREPKCPKCEA